MHAAFKPFALGRAAAGDARRAGPGLDAVERGGAGAVPAAAARHRPARRPRDIARGYAFFWWFADLTGMLHLRAMALDALAGERGSSSSPTIPACWTR